MMILHPCIVKIQRSTIIVVAAVINGVLETLIIRSIQQNAFNVMNTWQIRPFGVVLIVYVIAVVGSRITILT